MIGHAFDDLAYRRVLWIGNVICGTETLGVSDHGIGQCCDISDINGIDEIVF